MVRAVSQLLPPPSTPASPGIAGNGQPQAAGNNTSRNSRPLSPKSKRLMAARTDDAIDTSSVKSWQQVQDSLTALPVAKLKELPQARLITPIPRSPQMKVDKLLIYLK
ncbi:unnamed protein product [Polarella glacialis]|uniref:Uncharacterized protein n=1 Tax=Polarella glacialis TaxID=89957 RepID=A0A813GPU1_POLGL|nr:unnamed protein product [Polarella glacialis]CAE8659145.1 unnamed protein product [Polarella glacialis]CAE8696829.1 unnamed protein product [Polarella glacialis]